MSSFSGILGQVFLRFLWYHFVNLTTWKVLQNNLIVFKTPGNLVALTWYWPADLSLSKVHVF